MAKDLGAGQRVWIGWTPIERTDGVASAAACRTGEVIEYIGQIWREPYWSVWVDGVGQVSAVERLLTLIDDGDAERETERTGERETA